jgi:hypothetical protein
MSKMMAPIPDQTSPWIATWRRARAPVDTCQGKTKAYGGDRWHSRP